jgi:peptidase M23-like protein
MYRLPFKDDGKWKSAGNADDPSRQGHAPGGQFYAFDFRHNPEGAEVLAVRGGTVVFVENNQTCNTYNLPPGDPCEGKPGYGNAVLIRHLDNTVAAYNHMRKGTVTVQKDQVVVQGQKIGLSGNTGYSSEPHLHIDVRAYWNNENDFGSTFPIIFQDKNHVAWRPHVGDELHSDNDYKRQEQWKWCSKCQGLFFGGYSGSVCPAGPGGHTGGGNYILALNAANVPGQPDWRWCSKCQGLFYSKHSPSNCPAGPGGHTGGGNYSLEHDIGPDYNRQDDWYRCTKCQILFYGGNPGSVCPAGPGGHSKGGGNYVLYKARFNPVQGDWHKCS